MNAEMILCQSIYLDVSILRVKSPPSLDILNNSVIFVATVLILICMNAEMRLYYFVYLDLPILKIFHPPPPPIIMNNSVNLQATDLADFEGENLDWLGLSICRVEVLIFDILTSPPPSVSKNAITQIIEFEALVKKCDRAAHFSEKSENVVRRRRSRDLDFEMSDSSFNSRDNELILIV
ncbi:hypothetical protein MRB53_040050 [Persea americana]|nr:hypothetical protein MRB53_040050 [Persea americana]